MTNNDVLRRLRYALDLSNAKVAEAFRLAGKEAERAEIVALLKKEGEDGYLECDDERLEGFLDGLIMLRRGQRGEPGAAAAVGAEKLSNNDIMKKIRIALELKEGDMLEVFKLAGFPTSRSELTAVFRAKGHENFKACGDQMLRNFLKGLTIKFRGENAGK